MISLCEMCRCPVAVPDECPRLSKAFVPRRPRPLAQVAPPATGGAPLAPQTRTTFSFADCRSKKPPTQKGRGLFGAADRTRTGTLFRARDFKSLVSTYSTTAAYYLLVFKQKYLQTRFVSTYSPGLRFPSASLSLKRLRHLPTAAQRISAPVSAAGSGALCGHCGILYTRKEIATDRKRSSQ